MPIQTSPLRSSGTTLGYKLTSAATTYTVFGFVDSIDFGGVSVSPIDVTVLASTFKTYIPSIPDPGDLTFSIKYIPGDAGTVEIQNLAFTPAVVFFQVQLTDGSSPTTGTTLAFQGFVSNFAPKGFAVDGSPAADCTVQITGPITVTVGT